MAISVEIERLAILEMVLVGWKNEDGILINGERTRLPSWPNKVTFGGLQWICAKIRHGPGSCCYGDQDFAIYQPSR